MKNNENFLFILQELLKAKNKGYIEKINSVLNDSASKAKFHGYNMLINSDMTTLKEYVETLPVMGSIQAFFTSKIDLSRIRAVARLLEKKYNCKCDISPKILANVYVTEMDCFSDSSKVESYCININISNNGKS